MTQSYAHLFRLALQFMVLGTTTWILFTFTKNMLAGKPISIFNYDKMKRDFSHLTKEEMQTTLDTLMKSKYSSRT